MRKLLILLLFFSFSFSVAAEVVRKTAYEISFTHVSIKETGDNDFWGLAGDLIFKLRKAGMKFPLANKDYQSLRDEKGMTTISNSTSFIIPPGWIKNGQFSANFVVYDLDPVKDDTVFDIDFTVNVKVGTVTKTGDVSGNKFKVTIKEVNLFDDYKEWFDEDDAGNEKHNQFLEDQVYMMKAKVDMDHMRIIKEVDYDWMVAYAQKYNKAQILSLKKSIEHFNRNPEDGNLQFIIDYNDYLYNLDSEHIMSYQWYNEEFPIVKGNLKSLFIDR
jgi:hypothetical protein